MVEQCVSLQIDPSYSGWQSCVIVLAHEELMDLPESEATVAVSEATTTPLKLSESEPGRDYTSSPPL